MTWGDTLPFGSVVIRCTEALTFAHRVGIWNSSGCTLGAYRATLAKAGVPLGPSKPFLSAVEGGLGAENHHDMLSIKFFEGCNNLLPWSDRPGHPENPSVDLPLFWARGRGPCPVHLP